MNIFKKCCKAICKAVAFIFHCVEVVAAKAKELVEAVDNKIIVE